MSKSIDWYEQNSATVIDRYEGIDSDSLHDWLIDFLPSKSAMVLDIGAGTGRDAAWLASKGHDVIAVEPTPTLRKEAAKLHPEKSIQWIDDSLPSLEKTNRLGMKFDFILLSAVWMHVPPTERERAFRKITGLLKPGGVLALSLRHGPVDDGRGIYPVTLAEIVKLARNHGLIIGSTGESEDHLGRSEINWTTVALVSPDDGTGALPLLRHVILNDNKSSTYKLALLRALCRIAGGAPGFYRDYSDEYISLPLGLVALIWVRLYKPLLEANLPQNPSNRGCEKLRFAKQSFRELMNVSNLDLSVGIPFAGDDGAMLHGALRDAAETIEKMPATYMTYPDGSPILPVNRAKSYRRPEHILLDEAYLSGFGEMLVPRNLWSAMQSYDAWVEPALRAEWSRLIKTYATRQMRSVDDSVMSAAMEWDDPLRDVSLARDRAIELMGQGKLYCVWSGKRLGDATLDIDHCLPWSVWPCGDLWNLMPANRIINQKQKRDRLPSDGILNSAQDRILEWWDGAYARAVDPVSEQFWTGTRYSLPGSTGVKRHLPDIFDALCLQRLRLKHNQQVPEWPA